MNLMSLSWLTFGLLSTLALGFGFVCWWRSGRRFPRYIHRSAFVLGLVGALAAFTLSTTVGLGWMAAAACLLVPPFSAYLGWLWLGGPLLTEVGDRELPPA